MYIFRVAIHSADIIQSISTTESLGISVKGLSIDFRKIVDRVNKIINEESIKIRDELLQSTTQLLYAEEYRFVGKMKKCK